MSEPPPDSRPEKIPRPPNAWIIYRAEMIKDWPAPGPGQIRYSQGELSTILGDRWKTIDLATKRHYERLAEEAKAAHRLKYPNYKYEPKKKADKALEKSKGRKSRGTARAEKKVHRVGATASTAAPAPALVYQHLLVPNAHYYVPTMDFSHGGPSPPLSAASSPRASPSPELSSVADALEGSGSSSSSSSPFPAFPPTVLAPSPSPLPFPLISLPQSPDTPATAPEAQVSHSLQLESQTSQQSYADDQSTDQTLNLNMADSNPEHSTINSSFSWNGASTNDLHEGPDTTWNDPSLSEGGVSITEPAQLTFNLSEESAAQLDIWLQNNGLSEISNQIDNNGFSIPVNFDLDSYNSDFGGALEVTVGHVHGLYDAPNYVTEHYSNDIDPYSGQSDATLLSDFLMDYPSTSDGSYAEGSTSFLPPFPGMPTTYSETSTPVYDDSYNTTSMSAPPMALQPTPSFDTSINYALLQPVENSIQSCSAHMQPLPYVPPAGASNSNRRVAASYRKESFVGNSASTAQEVPTR